MRIRHAPSLVLLLAAFLLLVPLLLLANTLTIPNKSLAPGALVKSSEHNANNIAIESWANGFISDVNLLNNGITASQKIIDGTIDLAAMGTSSVDTTKIVDGTILNADVMDGTVTEAKLDIQNVPFSGARLTYNGTKPEWVGCSSIYNMSLNPPDDIGVSVYISATDRGIGGSSSSTTEADADDTIVPLTQIGGHLRVKLSTGPAVDDTWRITLRSNSAATSLTCTVATSATTCSDTTHFPAISAGSLIDVESLVIDGGNATDDTSAGEILIAFCLS